MGILNKNFSLSKGDLDVVSLGEILVDMISTEEVNSLSQSREYTRHFGGSPANIAVNLSRLGKKVALISRLGADAFGNYLLDVLKGEQIITDGIQQDKERRTTIVYVSKSTRTPDWLPYREADMYLQEDDIIFELIKRSKVFHLSTFILSRKPARDTAIKAFNYAREQGKIVCFDPCYRKVLWPEGDDGAGVVEEIISRADFVKPSLDDARHLFGPDSPENYVKRYLELGVKAVILTLGEEGVIASDGEEIIRIPAFSEDAVDVTGAGDAFWSGFICGLLDGYTVKRSIKLGNGVAAFKIRGVGALSPVPSKEDIIKEYNI
ncbi:carbohydrate kinase family protein [Halothermothrix orenii]|uniref:Fructokinase n=2 Tax=Halothermothrix orenii TaxID=31909 RepID=B8CZ52_HALOH|nr:sugar kinase [Halothermothrix orenii]ACB11222.1 putative LacI family regulatory protein [Halothermothrix orenii]ACL70571.1 Fructokinase [Halothermothrix orenii H 168]